MSCQCCRFRGSSYAWTANSNPLNNSSQEVNESRPHSFWFTINSAQTLTRKFIVSPDVSKKCSLLGTWCSGCSDSISSTAWNLCPPPYRKPSAFTFRSFPRWISTCWYEIPNSICLLLDSSDLSWLTANTTGSKSLAPWSWLFSSTCSLIRFSSFTLAISFWPCSFFIFTWPSQNTWHRPTSWRVRIKPCWPSWC